MCDYKIMNKEEDSYFIEFYIKEKAVEWLEYMKNKYPDYVKRHGMHIVESRRAKEKRQTERYISIARRLQAIEGGTIHVDGKSVTIKDFLEGKDI